MRPAHPVFLPAMSFVDNVRIRAHAGSGGNGCLSFLREKFRPFGGPDGGDGGDGGGIILVADPNYRTLLDFSLRPRLRAEDGAGGKGTLKAGKDGRDLVLRVPVGTMVWREGRLLADLSSGGQSVCVARGGRGGRGNAAFKTRHNTAPRICEKGEPGEEAELDLELKLIADVGLVGFPNSGKSTLLSRVSNARPKIADYPFTTLSPNLGLVRHKEENFVLADIPGLIEGAHEGRGLGVEFLRHIERTRVIVHLIDPGGFGGADPLAGIRVIEAELKGYRRRLAAKPRLLAVNKMDLPGAADVLRRVRKRYPKRKVFGLSAVTGAGVGAVLDAALRALSQAPREAAKPSAADGARREPFRLERGFEIRRPAEGVYGVSGPMIERLAAMTDFSLPESVRRFQNILRKVGLDRALKRAGVREGDTVRIGKAEFEWSDEEAMNRP